MPPDPTGSDPTSCLPPEKVGDQQQDDRAERATHEYNFLDGGVRFRHRELCRPTIPDALLALLPPSENCIASPARLLPFA
jgi:hypothetical protein